MFTAVPTYHLKQLLNMLIFYENIEANVRRMLEVFSFGDPYLASSETSLQEPGFSLCIRVTSSVENTQVPVTLTCQQDGGW